MNATVQGIQNCKVVANLPPNQVPSMIVVDGLLWVSMSGLETLLGIDQSIGYRRHGDFTLVFAVDNFGLVHHSSPQGAQFMVFVPPSCRVKVSCGLVEVMDYINYDSFAGALRKRDPLAIRGIRSLIWGNYLAGKCARHKTLGLVYVRDEMLGKVPLGYVPISDTSDKNHMIVPEEDLE